MADFYSPLPEARAEWDAWVASRPPLIRVLARRFPPWSLFRMRDSGHLVHAYSYSEDGTLTVIVGGTFNFVAFPRRVFGIRPDNLEPAELPPAEATVGAVLTRRKDIESFIEQNRPGVARPKGRG